MLPSPTAAATRLTGLEANVAGRRRCPGRSSRAGRGRVRAPSRPAGGHVCRPSARSRRSSSRDLGRQPPGLGVGADEDEEAAASRAASSRRSPSCGRRSPRCDSSPCAATTSEWNSARMFGRVAIWSIEVARHALLERLAAVDDGHAARVGREEHRGLPGRVAGADDVDVEPVRVRRLAPGRAVRDALAGEAVEALDRQLPPRDAAGEHDRHAPAGRRRRRGTPGGSSASIRVDRARDQDLARRAGAPAGARGSPAPRPRRPRESRGSSRSATRCPPARRAPRARRRSCAGPRRRRRPPPPARPGPRRRSPSSYSRGIRLGVELEQLRHAPQLRPDDASCRRRRGSPGGPPRVAAARPTARPHRPSSGWSQVNVIWFRSRKRRRSAHARVPAIADDDRARRRRLRGDAGQPARPAHPVRPRALQRP